MKNIVVLNDQDNVATSLLALEPNATIQVHIDGSEETIRVRDEVPFGHKVAIRPMSVGDNVLKYGEIIGKANDQRCFGTDDDEIDGSVATESDHSVVVGDVQVHGVCNICCSAIAGHAEKLCEERAGGDRPAKCVLPSARTDNEDPH